MATMPEVTEETSQKENNKNLIYNPCYPIENCALIVGNILHFTLEFWSILK